MFSYFIFALIVLLLACAAVILLLALLFFARLEQLHRRYRRAVEARHLERERIARDIHDTLLQGVQAILFRLKMWEEDPQIPRLLRTEMMAVAHQTESIVIEGRERILMMRPTAAPLTDLAQSLAAFENEVSVGQAPSFEVSVTGKPKTLSVEATEQLLDIAREAVRNAYQHAAASSIRVNLEYRTRSLTMTIIDDGLGFDSDTARGAAESAHFGLIGIRERARQLGARLHINSKAKMGTQIEIIVPARTAFQGAFKWPWQRRGSATLRLTHGPVITRDFSNADRDRAVSQNIQRRPELDLA
jgi:signal transduction histidine kinase